jgi:hypothetical protein
MAYKLSVSKQNKNFKIPDLDLKTLKIVLNTI